MTTYARHLTALTLLGLTLGLLDATGHAADFLTAAWPLRWWIAAAAFGVGVLAWAERRVA